MPFLSVLFAARFTSSTSLTSASPLSDQGENRFKIYFSNDKSIYWIRYLCSNVWYCILKLQAKVIEGKKIHWVSFTVKIKFKKSVYWKLDG